MAKEIEERIFPRRRTLTEDKPREDASQATESGDTSVGEETSAVPKKSNTEYYEAFNGTSIIDALTKIGEDPSFEHRIALGKVNGIPNYYGRPDQNIKLLRLAREGKLRRA